MITYAECEDEFARARCKRRGRPIANHTRIRRLTTYTYTSRRWPRLDYAIVYHDTAVVIVHADGSYTLDSGGWRTLTTMQRINHYSPAHLSGSAVSGWTGSMRNGNYRGGVAPRGTYARPWVLYRQGWRAMPGEPEYVDVRQPGRRAYLRAWRAWEATHYVPFYDGVRIGADGWPLDHPHEPYDLHAARAAIFGEGSPLLDF